MSAPKPMTDHYKRHCKLSIEEVMPHIVANLDAGKSAKIKVELGGIFVKVTGNRLQTFATKGCTCSSCNLKATHFAIETSAYTKGDPTWHLNLWGINDEGEEVLFTHDHTKARARGGVDDLTNTTTMCSPCNTVKAVQENPNYQIKGKS